MHMMTNDDITEIVSCKICNGDHLSACTERQAYKGYDVYCWDCERPTNKIIYILQEVT
jgi:hypothetical protein